MSKKLIFIKNEKINFFFNQFFAHNSIRGGLNQPFDHLEL